VSTQLPLVTIGVPVYNGERFLAEAVGSALAQDYGAIRVVIADNASTDGTPQIAGELAAADPRVAVIRHPVNIGANPNFNDLIERASSPYFKWLAADDRIEPRFVSACVAELEANPNAVLCTTAWSEIDEAGAASHVRAEDLALTSPSPAERFGRLVCANQGNMLVYGVIRTDSLRRTGRLAGYYGSERALLAELALMGNLVELPEALWASREHPGRSAHVRFDPSWAPDTGPRSALVHPAIALNLVGIIRRSRLPRRTRGAASARLVYCLLRRSPRLMPALAAQLRQAAQTALAGRSRQRAP
jgi:hypothetical protein